MRKKKVLDFCKATALAGGLLWGGAAWSSLANGDFSSGFTDWLGQAGDLTGVSDVTLPTSNFDASAGKAVLTTTWDIDEIYAVYLFQEFVVPTLALPGNNLFLSFDASWVADDYSPGGDNWMAQLVDQSSSPVGPLDLTGTGPFDITQFSGRTVQILFGLENIAGEDDLLTIDNVKIEERQAVPEPSTFLLLGVGLLVLGRKAFNDYGGY